MRTLIPAFLGLAIVVFAQDDPAYEKSMKTLGDHAGVIRKLTARTDPAVPANAEKIAHIYGDMKAFWQKRNVDDAVRWSDDGRSAALTLASAAKAGDSAKAEESWKALNGTCRQCHTAHREKLPDGAYRIK